MKITPDLQTELEQMGLLPQPVSAVKPRIHVQNITINNGSIIDLSENQIVVFVGPNNVGKSVTLKDIHSLMKDRAKPTTVVKSIKISYKDDRSEVLT